MKKWWKHCSENAISPYTFNLTHYLDFLTNIHNNGASYSTLNSYRSALSLILPIKENDENLVKRFFKGLLSLKPPKPKYNVTWDPYPVLKFLERYFPLEELPLEKLTLKLVTLMALTTAHRVQTISKISLNNINQYKDRIEIKISEKIKTSGKNKLQPVLTLPFFKDKIKICVATTLLHYIKVTKSLRKNNENSLFLTFKKPHHPATSQTLSRWIKSVLKLSGIDTDTFSAHSTRHAATSAAFRSGIHIDTIKNTAGWTKNSNVFNLFYNKPLTPDRGEFARAIVNSKN